MSGWDHPGSPWKQRRPLGAREHLVWPSRLLPPSQAAPLRLFCVWGGGGGWSERKNPPLWMTQNCWCQLFVRHAAGEDGALSGRKTPLPYLIWKMPAQRGRTDGHEMDKKMGDV